RDQLSKFILRERFRPMFPEPFFFLFQAKVSNYDSLFFQLGSLRRIQGRQIWIILQRWSPGKLVWLILKRWPIALSFTGKGSGKDQRCHNNASNRQGSGDGQNDPQLAFASLLAVESFCPGFVYGLT